jgi:hypothetical protein
MNAHRSTLSQEDRVLLAFLFFQLSIKNCPGTGQMSDMEMFDSNPAC